MKISQLITLLSQLDQEAEVLIDGGGCCGGCCGGEEPLEDVNEREGVVLFTQYPSLKQQYEPTAAPRSRHCERVGGRVGGRFACFEREVEVKIVNSREEAYAWVQQGVKE